MRILNILAHPVHFLALNLSRVRTPTHPHYHLARCGLGCSLILLGGFLASLHVSIVWPWLWDAFSYFVHGLGLAPLLTYISRIFPILAE